MADQDYDGFEPPADCDDTNPHINPDAVEIPYNGVDEDCDGSDLTDVDQDGFDSEEVGGDDCADANPNIHPDANEICGDNRDNNCDGYIDDNCWIEDPTDPGGISWTCNSAGSMSYEVCLTIIFVLIRFTFNNTNKIHKKGCKHIS